MSERRSPSILVATGWRIGTVAALLAVLLIIAVVKFTPKQATAPTGEASTAGQSASGAQASQIRNDAERVQRALTAGGQFWQFAMIGFTQTDPTTSGPAATTRTAARSLRVALLSQNVTTLRAFIAAGHAGEQRYCEQLIDRVRALGYTHVVRVLLGVLFGQSDLHAELSWDATSGYQYTVTDADAFAGAVASAEARPGATPLPAVTPFPGTPGF